MQAKAQIKIAIITSLIVIMICCVFPLCVLVCLAIFYHINIVPMDVILLSVIASPFMVYAMGLIKKDFTLAMSAYRFWLIAWYVLFATWSLCAVLILTFFWPLGVGFKIVTIGFAASILPWAIVFVMRMGLNGLAKLSEEL